jgi:poly(hydroxyalkanoate) depolymerase family esterase
MNMNLKSAMLAAAQLTAAGNLNAATQAIQRALGGDLPSASASSPFAASTRAAEPDGVIDVEARWVDDLQARLSDVARSAQSAFGAGMLGGAGQERSMADASPREKAATERMQTGRFTAAAGSRDYLLYLPPQAASAGPLPLVVMLHGCTQTPADFAAGTAMNELADRHGFVVLYPAQSKAANHSACWNWFEPRDQRAGDGEPSILAGMVRYVIDRHPIAPEQVFVAGLSAGGAMAAILGAAYPELFSAVAVHSGLPAGAAHDLQSALAAMKRGASPQSAGGGRLRSDAAARRPVRTIVFHGRQDRTVHPANGKQVVEAALAAFPEDALSARQESGRSPGGRSFVRTVHADGRGLPMVEQWEVQGAGHAWSGGRPSGSHTDKAGPDASAAMAAFFLAGS